MNDTMECSGSAYGHVLAKVYRRPWRKLWRRENVLLCWDCDFELVTETEADSNAFLRGYRTEGFDPSPFL